MSPVFYQKILKHGSAFLSEPKFSVFRMAKTPKIAKFLKNAGEKWDYFSRKILKNGYPFLLKSPLKMGRGFEARAAHPCPTQIWVPSRGCFGMYSKVSLIQRKRIFNQCVLPTMTYGCEIWNITKFLQQKLMTAQHAMERKMLHITLHDKVKNSVIRSKTKVKNLLQKNVIVFFFWKSNFKWHKKGPILHMTTTFSLKQGETRTSSGPIPHPLRLPYLQSCTTLWIGRKETDPHRRFYSHQTSKAEWIVEMYVICQAVNYKGFVYKYCHLVFFTYQNYPWNANRWKRSVFAVALFLLLLLEIDSLRSFRKVMQVKSFSNTDPIISKLVLTHFSSEFQFLKQKKGNLQF